MTTFVPRGYGAYPSYQFGLPNQYNNQYYYGGYGRQPTSFAPHYPTQPMYQPPMKRKDAYPPVPYYGPVKQPGLGTYAVMLFNRLDDQYRQEQYMRQLKKMERQYWKQQANNIPPQIYPANPIIDYVKETKYVPFPVYVNSGGGLVGGVGGQGLFGAQNAPVSAAMSLPPKIRVIFIPNGQSFAQQPYTGSLAMPPFLYNRMSQPLCSFPLPPPLPQVASLPLTPAVQQIVAQRYSNPVAVLPFPSNWPVSQPAISSCPSGLQQQQYAPQISAPQPYILPPAAPAYSSAPQQQYTPQIPSFPAPSSVPPTYTSPPIINIPPPSTTFVSSFQPAAQVPAPSVVTTYYQPNPQSYMPVSSIASDSSTSLSAPNSQPSSSNTNVPSSALPSQSAILNNDAVSSAPQYPHNGYPSICRACPPAPPPLNMPVSGYCWVQHCSACHHVPLPNAYPNSRPVTGRNTPLLRQPTVPQYIPEQSYQQYRRADPPVMMRPWLRKTPPLPPGAVVVSDEYIYKNGSNARYGYSQRTSRHYDRSSRPQHRSTTITSRVVSGANSTNAFNARSVSPRKLYKTSNNNNPNVNAPQSQRSTVSKNTQSPSTSTTSTNLSDEYEKIVIASPAQTNRTTVPQAIAREARNVNLQYKYQPQELPTVYHVNRYLKSSSEGSSLSTNTESEFHGRSPSMKDRNLITPSTEQEDEKPPRPPSHTKKSKEKVLIIREFTTSSPSTISTVSSNMSFSIIIKDDDGDGDSLSTTSTINEHKQEENETLHRHIF